MYGVVRKPEVDRNSQDLANGFERPCRGCEKLVGISILYDVSVCGRVPLNYHYSCEEGSVLSAISKRDGGCPINSFKPSKGGEIELTPESLIKNGFRKLNYEKYIAKLDPNHPEAKRYGEIIIHPGEGLLRFISQIYDVWIKAREINDEK
ncbi:MAG: hypothetical protein KIH08_10015 [Candidatus Freyarchaeota archaeon]|nr:hypothetical protein [Candidatus Jordarchaeia archaeon]MBS7269962.1 hypothetical protein [Candidatus Jordarchaeia archaeon]MBS7280658.1 hypothetical protein [Candidatus Jordarchaeia archaeon]